MKHHVVQRTETLKILFALYFKVLKLDFTSPLLGPALEGLARFAHLINVDFFRDLLENLKLLVRRSEEVAEESKSLQPLNTRQQLLCVVTAFELLSGQGELYLSVFSSQFDNADLCEMHQVKLSTSI